MLQSGSLLCRPVTGVERGFAAKQLFFGDSTDLLLGGEPMTALIGLAGYYIRGTLNRLGWIKNLQWAQSDPASLDILIALIVAGVSWQYEFSL